MSQIGVQLSHPKKNIYCASSAGKNTKNKSPFSPFVVSALISHKKPSSIVLGTRSQITKSHDHRNIQWWAIAKCKKNKLNLSIKVLLSSFLVDVILYKDVQWSSDVSMPRPNPGSPGAAARPPYLRPTPLATLYNSRAARCRTQAVPGPDTSRQATASTSSSSVMIGGMGG